MLQDLIPTWVEIPPFPFSVSFFLILVIFLTITDNIVCLNTKVYIVISL